MPAEKPWGNVQVRNRMICLMIDGIEHVIPPMAARRIGGELHQAAAESDWQPSPTAPRGSETETPQPA